MRKDQARVEVLSLLSRELQASRVARPPQVGPQESLTFDLVDQGEPEDTDEMQDPDETGPAPSLHGEELIPAKTPDSRSRLAGLPGIQGNDAKGSQCSH
jgi:hypothetical protein